jgi:membrane-associated protein
MTAAMTELLHHLETAIIAAAEHPWVLLAVFALCMIDGFFPPLPSESVVISIAALAVHGDAVPLWAVIATAAAGAAAGDLIAFSLGRHIPLHQLRPFRTGRGQRLLSWAERQLRVRGGVFILSARYVPVGRVAVNLTAGAVGFPLRRFLAYDAIAAVMWASFSAFIGVAAGALFHGNPLLSIAAGITAGLLVGLLLDKLFARLGLGPTQLQPTRHTAKSEPS